MDYLQKEQLLLDNIHKSKEELETLLEDVNSHWKREDLVYRYYHQSFKVYRVQGVTQGMVSLLEEISPHEEDHFTPFFSTILESGTKNLVWVPQHNENWENICRPMLEAFFHAHYFLDMAVKYGKEYKSPPKTLDSGWAALLSLYDIR